MSTALRLVSIALILGAVLAACGDDDDDDDGGATATPTTAAAAEASPTEAASEASPTEPTGNVTSTPAGDDETAVAQAADAVLEAIRRHDRDRLHDHTGHHLRGHTHDRDLDHLAQCMPAGASMEVVERSVEIEDGTATVTQTLELTTADGETTRIERVLTFERDESGKWVLTEMPECPFQQ